MKDPAFVKLVRHWKKDSASAVHEVKARQHFRPKRVRLYLKRKDALRQEARRLRKQAVQRERAIQRSEQGRP